MQLEAHEAQLTLMSGNYDPVLQLLNVSVFLVPARRNQQTHRMKIYQKSVLADGTENCGSLKSLLFMLWKIGIFQQY